MKYKLSLYIKLEFRSNCFVIINTYRRERVFKINETIYEFLLHFQTPNSINNVIDTYTSDFEDNKDEVREFLTSFFNKMIKERVLVYENQYEPLLEHKTFYRSGEIIDEKYIVIDILSNNKYIDIYLVKDNKCKQLVLKLLNIKKFFEKEEYETYIKILKKEYYFLNNFNHRNIINVHEFSNKKTHIYYTMDDIKGVNLDKYISEKANDEFHFKIIEQIITVFAYIHKCGVFHGDIHFGNILVSKNAEIKIIDFGMSEEINNNLNLKAGGIHIFVPPERYIYGGKSKFGKIKDFSSDIYQIGIIIYFILFKKSPFFAETIRSLFEEKKNYNPNEDPNIIKFENTKYKIILNKCLSKLSTDRFSNASEILKVLKQ